jgi:hypothetical protein
LAKSRAARETPPKSNQPICDRIDRTPTSILHFSLLSSLLNWSLKVFAFTSCESACVQPFVRQRAGRVALWYVLLFLPRPNENVLLVFEQSSVPAWRAQFSKLRDVLLGGEPRSLLARGAQMVFDPIGCASRRVGHFVESFRTLSLFQARAVSRQNDGLSKVR